MIQAKNFAFGEDEKMLRDTARKFLQDSLPTDKLHQLVASDSDPYREPPCHWNKNLWLQIVELGWTTVIVPENNGGSGMSMVALCALLEETGRAALPSPFTATAIASLILRECHTAPANDLLQKITSGTTATLANTPKNASWLASDCDVYLVDGSLNGSAYFVQDARKVDTLLVQCKTETGLALYAVPVDSEGVEIVADSIIDLTRDQAHIHFHHTNVNDAQLLSHEAGDIIERTEPGILTLVSADICGAAEWQLQTTVEYMKVREQFDHPLGYFQALKHPLVNVMIMIDQAKSLTYNAACAIDSEPENAAKFARMAKASASELAAFASSRSIQFHGGIGFTWECFVHLYSKRQKHNQVLYGDAKYQRAKLADLLMGPLV